MSKNRVDNGTRSPYYEGMKTQSQNEIDYERIEKAIIYLNERVSEQPDLDMVAAYVGVSPFHFHRLFTRWAGVSPKKFLSLLTLNHAKEILRRNSATLLDAAHESGLSGTGRLHDLFVNIEAMTPGEYKRSGKSVEIRYGIHPTPFGRALICVTERGICGLAFTGPATNSEALEDQQRRWPLSTFREDSTHTAPYADDIFSTGKEDNRKGTLNCLVKGSPFQIKVWEALLMIRAGSVTTYGDVAAAVGKPAAARAAANAVGANPIAYLIPCHRVIRASGAIGGYRWGAVRKQAMLSWESV